MAPTELAAVAFGIGYLLLAIRERRACWIAGGISTALYAVVFWRAALPMQAGLQVVYVALSAWGWVAWGRPREDARQRRWTPARHGAALAGVVLATALTVPFTAAGTPAAAPVADALGTWASLVATWLLLRRVAAAWIWWIAIDAGLAALFAWQGLAMTGALYLGYALLAAAGWRRWRRRAAA